jgi:hypothetical protein
MPKRKFPRSLLRGTWGLPYGAPGVAVINDEHFDSGRWSEHHRLIFIAPDDEKMWRVEYATGLTEIQDHRAWDDEDPNVELDGMVEGVQVEPYERVVIDYKEVE